MNPDGLVDGRDVGCDDRPEVVHLHVREHEGLSGIDQVLAPRVLGHVARSRHERAGARDGVGVGGLDWKVKRDGGEPSPF